MPGLCSAAVLQAQHAWHLSRLCFSTVAVEASIVAAFWHSHQAQLAVQLQGCGMHMGVEPGATCLAPLRLGRCLPSYAFLLLTLKCCCVAAPL